MKTDYFNLWWKLHESVRYLATGPGNLKARLKNVLHSHLIHLGLPSNASSEVEHLIAEAITLATTDKAESGRIGHVYLTLARSHWTKDQLIAKKIFQAYELASKEYYETEDR
jgi:hypothetical protein